MVFAVDEGFQSDVLSQYRLQSLIQICFDFRVDVVTFFFNAVVRADNYGWGDGYAACLTSGGQADWVAWRDEMNGAKVTVYVTNCGNGTADVQAVMVGNAGTTSTQYYLGINTIDPNDLNFALTVENAHLIFGE